MDSNEFTEDVSFFSDFHQTGIINLDTILTPCRVKLPTF